jgi:hypothetical protein
MITSTSLASALIFLGCVALAVSIFGTARGAAIAGIGAALGEGAAALATSIRTVMAGGWP